MTQTESTSGMSNDSALGSKFNTVGLIVDRASNLCKEMTEQSERVENWTKIGPWKFNHSTSNQQQESAPFDEPTAMSMAQANEMSRYKKSIEKAHRLRDQIEDNEKPKSFTRIYFSQWTNKFYPFCWTFQVDTWWWIFWINDLQMNFELKMSVISIPDQFVKHNRKLQ